MVVWFPKTHPVPRWLGHNNGLYTQGPICHPSSCQFVRHSIFFGLPSFCILELLRGPPLASRSRKKDGWIDPNTQHKILTSSREVQHRLFSHISSIVHLGLAIDVCIDIVPGLLEMREIGQGMGVWFSIVWGSPSLGFLGSYIIESLSQACQASNGSIKLSSLSGKTVLSDN
jgi:hypothetical protein